MLKYNLMVNKDDQNLYFYTTMVMFLRKQRL